MLSGNDFDLFMLFTADFMLNGIKHHSCGSGESRSGDGSTVAHERLPVCPWVHSLCNNLSHADALRTVMVPDAAAAVILLGSLEGGGSLPEAPASAPAAIPEALAGASADDDAAVAAALSRSASERDLSMCAGEFLLSYDDGDVGTVTAAVRLLASCRLALCDSYQAQLSSCRRACVPCRLLVRHVTIGEVRPSPSAHCLPTSMCVCAPQWDGFASCFFLDTAPNPIE